MARKHALVIAIVLGLAAAIGATAAIGTARLARPQATAGSTQSSSAQLRKRSRLLSIQAASLRQALAKRPPKLPKVPAFAPAVTSGSSRAPAAATAPAPRVQFVHPAPVIVVTHRSHEGGDDAGEHDDEGGGGGDD